MFHIIECVHEVVLMPNGQAVIFLVWVLLCATNEGVLATEWKFYARSEFGLYQYDTEDVSHFSANVVRVSQRLVMNKRGTTNLVRELGKEFEKVKEIIILREIDCTGKKSHILNLTYWSGIGEVIKRESYEPIEWDSIIPDSVDDVLYHMICE